MLNLLKTFAQFTDQASHISFVLALLIAIIKTFLSVIASNDSEGMMMRVL